MKKLIINDIIIVEGKDDITALKKVVEAKIIALNGLSALNKKKLDYLTSLSEKNKLLIFTDPDHAGKLIRQKISQHMDNIEHIYINRDEAYNNGNIGVENANPTVLYDLLLPFSLNNNIKEKNNIHKYSMDDMIEYQLTVEKNAKARRILLCELLNISYSNSKQLFHTINTLNISKDEMDSLILQVNEMIKYKDKDGIIFGKFIPLHKGHINFIKLAAKYVNNLYIYVCSDDIRDNNLLAKSTLPKYISSEDRVSFVKKELKGYKKIKVFHLKEDGINPYPNGWEEWSNRVKTLANKENINPTVVFTNEVQDIENYKKYFNNISIINIDLERHAYNISSTKIRDNYNKNKEYLPISVLNFLERKE